VVCSRVFPPRKPGWNFRKVTRSLPRLCFARDANAVEVAMPAASMGEKKEQSGEEVIGII
jgi:hypothetical protein